MATGNPFDLLGDDDSGDLTVVLNAPVVAKEKQGVKKGSGNAPVRTTAVAPSKLPSKPLPPAQAVREARASQTEGGRSRGGSGRGGRGFSGNRDQDFGRGRGGNYNSERGFNHDSYDGYGDRGGFNERNVDFPPGRQEDGEVASAERRRGGGRGGGRGGRGGRGFGGGRGVGGDAGDEDNSKRMYDRRSGTGHGTEIKREGSGRGNWGTPVEEALQEPEEPTSAGEEKLPTLEKTEDETNKESSLDEEKKQEEDKEMTLDEYEKLLEEKRKKLLGVQKVEERKVDATAFESMKQLSTKKKDEDPVFIKVSSEKDKEKKSDAGERDERMRKPMSINEFLKPAEGERSYGGGRGRGRGRGNRGGFTGAFGGSDNALQLEAPSIEDPRHFPTLGGK